jgi:YidC/Oxa1 family membrane protein insertase
MKSDHRNMILAIILSVAVLFGWQYFVAGPQMEQAQNRARIAAQQEQAQKPSADHNLATPEITAGGPATMPAAQASNGGVGTFANRETAIGANPRVTIDTPALGGSINLVGARIDDLKLKDYHETVDPTSPIITLLNPSGAPDGYYIEHGFVPADTSGTAVPTPTTQWTADAGAVLTPQTPVTLSWDNGAGLVFHRTIAVDSQYLFTVSQTVENHGSSPVSLYPYARIERQGTPKVQNFFVQHEGPLALLGSNNLISKKYTDLQNDAKDGKDNRFDNTEGWLGITDKYWATAIIADPKATINGRLTDARQGAADVYQTSYVESTPMVVPAGGTAANTSYVFAGAKKEGILDGYQKTYGFDRLDLLIDWGWLFFFTKPVFYLLQFLYGFLGNFGLAILAVTVIVKAIFFPLASRSYASMAAMRRVQPEMKAIQERFKEDRAAQQLAMLELYLK